MRILLLSALLLASAFQTALGQQSGDWTYSVSNNEATITGYLGADGAVTIPSLVNGISVTNIGEWLFNNRPNITSITIPSSVKIIGVGAFRLCPGLTSITIPNSVTSIGTYAFQFCTALTSINIPNSVTSIGDHAFSACSALTSITIPNGVTSIGIDAFSGCSALTSINIPNSVTSIGQNAFSACSALTTITIPNGVTSIGENPFSYCVGLIAITVTESNPSYSSDAHGVLFNKDKTTLIKYPLGRQGTYTIPDSVTSIGDHAFESSTGLPGITIPDTVTSVGSYAFQSCTSLTSILMGSGLTNIGDGAFSYLTSLTAVTIPNNVTIIGNSVFAGCTGLTSITIPNRVTSLGWGVFFGCTALTNVTITERYIGSVSNLGLQDAGATSALINGIANNLANNDAFITALANKILAKSGNYGLSVKSELGALATKTELTSSLTQSRTDGINSVLSNPNLWTLYTTSQIQNMAVGDLVLTRQVSGGFVLNYDIEQSTDLQTWTPYQALSLPLTGLPTDKAFVRIKAKQDGVSNSSSSQTTPTTPTFGGLYNGSSGVSSPGGLYPPNYNGGSSGISPDWLNSLPTVPLGPIEEE